MITCTCCEAELQAHQMWEMRRHEAEHIRDIRQLRLLWDGVVRIGEDVA